MTENKQRTELSYWNMTKIFFYLYIANSILLPILANIIAILNPYLFPDAFYHSLIVLLQIILTIWLIYNYTSRIYGKGKFADFMSVKQCRILDYLIAICIGVLISIICSYIDTTLIDAIKEILKTEPENIPYAFVMRILNNIFLIILLTGYIYRFLEKKYNRLISFSVITTLSLLLILLPLIYTPAGIFSKLDIHKPDISLLLFQMCPLLPLFILRFVYNSILPAAVYFITYNISILTISIIINV